MQTNLAPEYRSTPEGLEAEAILRKCVHCGFCTATCPTYQQLGDELDGPRGRIYLIKQVLEGATPSRATQQHLDRCLTCRNCESTCPSGVQYGHLVDIGRKVVDAQVPRPLGERVKRWALKEGISSPLFAPAMKLGQAVRPLLPEALQAKVPPKSAHGVWPTREHVRKVLLLAGCVQPSMLPNINYATARVLDAVGIQTVIADKAGCCGAVKFHLNDQDAAKDQMRANIDAWWPMVEAGQVEAVVSNASGCGAMVKDYAHALRDDAAYAAKAQRVSTLARDLSELLPALLPELADKLAGRAQVPRQPMAYHPPCTLQHAQKIKGVVEANLGKLGFQLRTARTESHLCCGSAGTYSILQSDMAQQLRTRKLDALDEAFEGGAPAAILSANIGCITHLQAGTAIPVKHWVEVLDEALTPP
ncbi:glycolate oxidase subunit GlcF [Comamonas sp. GB3 AK4-5]|uniref:glycolate oxidase subunit GlcF n=1 Tax=Comamonas sp. GB3 AK4-5 TaxID=3231487 RepID=UPI00351EF709